MLVLVTGATGLLGNNVVRLLLQQGHQVRVLVRDPRIDKSLAGLNVEVVPGDLREPDQIATATIGADVVINSAAMVHIGWHKEKLMQQVNIEGAKAIGEAALKQGARLVHVSSVDALGVATEDAPHDETSPREGKVPCPYVLTKRAAEEELQKLFAQGLNGLIVNPALMFGPWDWKPSSGRMILSVVKNQPPLAPRGGGSVCDVRDVAAAIVTAMQKGNVGENYILAGENLRYVDLWRKIAEITGCRAPWGRMGPLVALAAGWCGDMWSQMDGQEAEVNSAAIRVSNQFHYYRSDKAMRDLNYRMRPVDQTIRDAWAWFQKHGYGVPAKASRAG